MRNFVRAIVSIILFSVLAIAQQTFHVGEDVEYKCSRSTGWCAGKVEAIDGNMIRVRWGNVRSQFDTVKNSPEFIRPVPKPDSPQIVAFQEAFRAEALNKYIRDLDMLAHYYDEQFLQGGGHDKLADWQAMNQRLGELDALCRGKYAGVTNIGLVGTGSLLLPGRIDYRYADWCKIAANRDALGLKARQATAIHMGSLPGADDLKKSLEYQDNRAGDNVQMLMYEPEKWKAENSAKLKPYFANYGVEMPQNFLDEVLTKAAELKSKIDQGAPGRSFEMSAAAARDAAVENFIKGKWAAEYPGSQVLKTSHSYPTWVKRESLSLVGSGPGYKLYKVEYNFYKRGWVLMKMPNRPYCQAREWIVGRGAKGLVAVSTSSQGTFMKCQ